MGQGAPYGHDVASPPHYASVGDPSTSSGIVVASRSGNLVPVAASSPSVPTNGVSVATVLEPIRGLLDCYIRGKMPTPNTWLSLRFLATRPIGHTALEFLYFAGNCRKPY